jgi:hypothetical protein
MSTKVLVKMGIPVLDKEGETNYSMLSNKETLDYASLYISDIILNFFYSQSGHYLALSEEFTEPKYEAKKIL